MSTENNPNRAVHAWLLVFAKADDLRALAEEILEAANTAYSDSEKTRINRADVTDGPFNLVVQVNAENDDDLKAIVSHVVKFDGVKQLLVARVLDYVPGLPSEADPTLIDDELGPPDLAFGENAWG